MSAQSQRRIVIQSEVRMGRLEDWIFLVETLTDEDGELLLSKFDDEENEEEYSEEDSDPEIPRRANTLKN